MKTSKEVPLKIRLSKETVQIHYRKWVTDDNQNNVPVKTLANANEILGHPYEFIRLFMVECEYIGKSAYKVVELKSGLNIDTEYTLSKNTCLDKFRKDFLSKGKTLHDFVVSINKAVNKYGAANLTDYLNNDNNFPYYLL